MALPTSRSSHKKLCSKYLSISLSIEFGVPRRVNIASINTKLFLNNADFRCYRYEALAWNPF